MEAMTNQQILEKAIQKAIDNGWRYLGLPENGWGVGAGQWHTSEHHLTINRGKFGDELIHRNAIIFNHDFAKALWGNGRMPKTGTTPGDMERTTFNGEEWALPMWAWHLQQMVIAEDPIKYLGEHLNA